MSLDIEHIQSDYGDPEDEAHACRTAAALFDFSFVSRARVEGPGALRALATLTTRPLADMRPGDIRYAVRCDSAGHLVCDLTIWRMGEAEWEVMSGRRQDITDVLQAANDQARITDMSNASMIFAVQGPGALAALAGIADTSALAGIGYFKHSESMIAGLRCQIGRLGYTGEQGFEIVAPREEGPALWRTLSARARPAGFIAADRLRIEAGFILFTNELAIPVTPFEAGVGQFAGAKQDTGPEQEIELVCLTASKRDIQLPWQARGALRRPSRPGEVMVTSACRSSLADGLLLLGFARATDLATNADLRDSTGEFAGLRRVSLPFYDPQKRRPRAPLLVPTITDRRHV